MIACVVVPYFAASIEGRENPAFAKTPLVLVSYSGQRGSVYAVCHQAASFGVMPGMTPAQARALCPDARLELADLSRYRRAFEHVLEILRDYSNYLEPRKLANGQTAVFYLDYGKLRPSDALRLSHKLIDTLREQTGLCASVGLAMGKFPAYVAAGSQRPGEMRLIQPGQEAAFLASHPVTLLPFGKEPQRRLRLLGITTIGQYAALPRVAVFAQFGEKGRRLHQWASGQDERRVPFFKPERVEYAEHDFDDPVSDGQILEAVLHRLADDLAGRLAADSLECREVALALRLEDRLTRDGSLNLGQPVASGGGITKKLWFLLRQITITGGVMRVGVCLSDIRPVLPRQLSLFDDLDGGEHLRETLIDLTARHGACFFVPLLHHPAALLPEYRFSLEDVASA